MGVYLYLYSDEIQTRKESSTTSERRAEERRWAERTSARAAEWNDVIPSLATIKKSTHCGAFFYGYYKDRGSEPQEGLAG